MTIKLVIFDCDGVLMDSEIIAAQAEASVYKNHGADPDVNEFALRFAGLTSDAIKSQLEADLGRFFPESILEEIQTEVDAQCGSQAPIIPGALEVLDQFDQARCICSNSPPERLKAMLSRVGLYDRFRPYIFSSRSLSPPAPKPKPDIFLHALNEFDVAPDEALVIEDSIHGIEGAVRAGTKAVGFAGASHCQMGYSELLMDAGAQTVIRRLGDLPELIEAMHHWSVLD